MCLIIYTPFTGSLPLALVYYGFGCVPTEGFLTQNTFSRKQGVCTDFTWIKKKQRHADIQMRLLYLPVTIISDVAVNGRFSSSVP